VQITLLGHNCFRLSGRDVTLVTDPFAPAEGSLRVSGERERVSADIVTVSRDEPGYNAVEAVGGEPRAVTGPGAYEIKGVLITGVGTFRDAEHGKARGRNTVYLIELDDLRVCHLGNLGHVLETEQVDEIGTVDVLFVPASAPQTLSSAQISEVISQLEPSTVVPMGWTARDGEATGPTGAAGVTPALERFCHEMGIKEIEFQQRYTVTKGPRPAEAQAVQVALLEPRGNM